MRTAVERIDLVGTSRCVTFRPGLNIVTGPIASGKTTLVNLVRFLLGGKLGSLPPEARQAVTAVSGSLALGKTTYSVVRPAVTTSSARVDLASDDAAWRLPASGRREGETYASWLLERLSLPRLEVPSAPTKPDSDSTPVSIRDYWLYSFMSQKELGFEIFGHKDPFKNIKRKYVFDIVYGFYDVETAELQEQLRTISAKLRHLSSQMELFKGFFEDTALENRAALEHELKAVRRQIAHVEAETVGVAKAADQPAGTTELQQQVLHLEGELERARTSERAEQISIGNLEELIAQLESQSGKLTRAIVAGTHLTDIDFVVCPRCGSDLVPARGSADICYLCLQEPSLDFSREVLVGEQDVVEAQLVEAQDLLRERQSRVKRVRENADDLEQELQRARNELDFHTRAFVSERAQRIASAARERAVLKAREAQLREYLSVLSKLDTSEQRRAELVVERDRIENQLDSKQDSGEDAWARVQRLESRYNEIIERFKSPEFGEEIASSIDRSTYLPLYRGRRFESLSSPGLATLVSIAYALAHHVTATELDLILPGILVIDGLSEHLGKEGLDPERLQAVYEYLVEISDEMRESLQVLVVDNEVPDVARPYIQLELSETDRLIPTDDIPPSRGAAEDQAL